MGVRSLVYKKFSENIAYTINKTGKALVPWAVSKNIISIKVRHTVVDPGKATRPPTEEQTN